MIGAAEDDQNIVIPCHRSYDLRPLLPIQRNGDWLSPAGQRLHDEQIPDTVRPKIERGEKPGESWCGIGDVGWDDVDRSPVIIRHLHQTELPDVSRQSRLGYIEAALREPLAQNLLRGNAKMSDDVQDLGVTLWLQHRSWTCGEGSTGTDSVPGS